MAKLSIILKLCLGNLHFWNMSNMFSCPCFGCIFIFCIGEINFWLSYFRYYFSLHSVAAKSSFLFCRLSLHYVGHFHCCAKALNFYMFSFVNYWYICCIIESESLCPMLMFSRVWHVLRCRRFCVYVLRIIFLIHFNFNLMPHENYGSRFSLLYVDIQLSKQCFLSDYLSFSVSFGLLVKDQSDEHSLSHFCIFNSIGWIYMSASVSWLVFFFFLFASPMLAFFLLIIVVL